MPFMNNVFWVDPIKGSDDEDGLSRVTAKASSAAALALCTADQDDTVILLNKETLTSNLDWNKKKTHLLGASAACSLVGGAGFQSVAAAVTSLFTLSANECIFQNLFFDNYGTDAACIEALVVSGILNQFVNCSSYLGNNGSAALDVATASDLKVTGGYNRFTDCRIGSGYSLTGATRGALRVDNMPSELLFDNCIFRMDSSESGAGCVKYDMIEDIRWSHIYRNCTFLGLCSVATGSAAIDDIFIVGTVSGAGSIALLQDSVFYGATDWADENIKAYIFTNQDAGNGAGGKAVVTTGT